jgi:hypothetical protein
MVGRMSVLAGLMAAVVAASAAAQAKVYETPQKVFDAATAAAKKGDMKAFFALLDPDSVNQLTAGMAVSATFVRGLADLDKTGKTKEALKPLEKVMDKHGLTAEATKKLKPIKPEKDLQKLAKEAKPLLELIKDKPGFISDVLPVFEKLTKKGDGDDGFKAMGSAKLKDVKVDGDKATGTVVMKKGDEDKSEPIKFVKVGKGWRIKYEPKAKDKDKDKDKGKDD